MPRLTRLARWTALCTALLIGSLANATPEVSYNEGSLTITAKLINRDSGLVNVVVTVPCSNSNCWIAFGISDKAPGSPKLGSMLGHAVLGEAASSVREVDITQKSASGVNTAGTNSLVESSYTVDGDNRVLNFTTSAIAGQSFGNGEQRYIVAFGNEATLANRHAFREATDDAFVPLFLTANNPTTSPSVAPVGNSTNNETATDIPTASPTTLMPTTSPTITPTSSPIESGRTVTSVTATLPKTTIAAQTTEIPGQVNFEIRVECLNPCWIGFGVSDKSPGEPEEFSMHSTSVIADSSGVKEAIITSRSLGGIQFQSELSILSSYSYVHENGVQIFNFTSSGFTGPGFGQGNQRYILAHGNTAALGYHSSTRYPDSLDNFLAPLDLGEGTTPPSGAPTRKPTGAPTEATVDIVLNPLDDLKVTIIQVDESKVRIIAELNREAWLAIGISNSKSQVSMLSNTVIAKPGTANEVDEYTITAKSTSAIRSAANEDNLEDVVLTQAGGKTTLEFTTGRIGSADLNFDDSDIMVFAHGTSNNFEYHGGTKTGSRVEYKSTGSTSEPIATQNVPGLVLLHAALMVLAWMIIFPIGALFVSLFKASPGTVKDVWLFKMHERLQSLGTLLTLVGFIAIVVSVSNSGAEHFTRSHPQFGLALVILVTVHVIAASQRPHKPNKLLGEKDKPSTTRTLWEYAHRLFGIFFVIGGMVQCYIGASDELQAPQGTITGFVTVCVIGTLLIAVVLGKIVVLKREPRPLYNDDEQQQEGQALNGDPGPVEVELTNT